MNRKLLIGTGLLIASILLSAVIRLLRKGVTDGFIAVSKKELNTLTTPVGSLIFSVMGLVTLPYLNLNTPLYTWFAQIIKMCVIASAGYLGIRVVTIVKDIYLKRHDIAAADNLAARGIHTQIGVMQSIANVVIIILTAACMIMVFPRMRQVGLSLLASAGVMGIVLGLAAQKTLGNLIAGIQIAITQPIRIDDVLVVEDEWGWVEEITLTYVVVRIWDLRRLILPISYFIEKPFQNWTRTSADILGTVYLYADYTAPVDKIREKLTQLLESSPHWDKKVNGLQVTKASEKTVELRALMSANSSPAAWTLRCEVREKLLLYLQTEFPEALPKVRLEMEKDRDLA